jgi:hypothetical protein
LSGLTENNKQNSVRGMESSRTLHFAAAGMKSQQIGIAPEADEPESNRYGLLTSGDDLLDKNQKELEVGTKERNRAFQDRLDDVWKSTAGYEAILKVEAKEATETILDIKEKYQKAIDDFDILLQKEINEAFDKIDNEMIPVQEKRRDVIEAGVDVFVKETVPANIERQSGEVSRRLKKAYEAFDIEQQKERNRETKFVNNANDYIQNTAQRFADELAMMTANLYTLEDDVIENERRASRMHYRRHDLAVIDIKKIRKVVARERNFRAKEDADLLDTVIETQQLLQQTVLEHFGASGESDGDLPEPPKLDKLEARMEVAASRRGSRANNIIPDEGKE